MPENVAILVIHGIGEQRAYETLDQFTQGLEKTFTQMTLEPRMEICRDPLREQKQWVRAACVMCSEVGEAFKSDQAAGGSAIGKISLFEYYWAPVTQDKVTYTGSLMFLIRAGLTPFLYFGANLKALTSVGKRRDIWKVIAREIVRQTLLFLPLLLLFALTLRYVAVFSEPRRLLHLYQEIPSWSKLLVVLLVIRYLYLVTNLKALLNTRDASYSWQTSWWWRGLLALGISFHLFAWLWISCALRWIANFGTWIARHWTKLPELVGHWSGLLRELARWTELPSHGEGWRAILNDFFFLKPSFSHYRYLSIVAFFVLAYFVRWILMNYIGDLAVYTNSSELAANFAARAQILDECTGTLSQIVRQRVDEENVESKYVYDRVLVVGHSLGSVIAYDTINELLNRCRAGRPNHPDDVQPDDLDKLRGMVTFGCPLNKIFYFFREKMPAAQVVRRQILDLLHGFRLVDTICSYPPGGNGPGGPMQRNNSPRWAQAEGLLANGFRWINAWAPADPVSGKLLFYDLKSDENQMMFWYGPWNFGRAHNMYWKDEDFYNFVRQRLL